MSDKPTGVFLRLPLSDEQRGKIVAEMMPAPISVSDAFSKTALNIGTPVTGGDAPIVDYSEYEPEYHNQGMGCGLEDRGIHDRYEAMAYGWDQAMDRVCSEFPETVLLSDHQAQIAALEAEVVRLREALDRIRLIPFPMMDLPAGIMHGIAHKALKGGAA
jgi:hypothetical protein